MRTQRCGRNEVGATRWAQNAHQPPSITDKERTHALPNLRGLVVEQHVPRARVHLRLHRRHALAPNLDHRRVGQLIEGAKHHQRRHTNIRHHGFDAAHEERAEILHNPQKCCATRHRACHKLLANRRRNRRRIRKVQAHHFVKARVVFDVERKFARRDARHEVVLFRRDHTRWREQRDFPHRLGICRSVGRRKRATHRCPNHVHLSELLVLAEALNGVDVEAPVVGTIAVHGVLAEAGKIRNHHAVGRPEQARRLNHGFR